MAYSFKGAIAFGLVYIPVALVASIKNNDIGFNMIDKKTMSRVKYKKTCVDCENREVKNEDIVKGYQYEKGKYVIFTDKEFEKIKTEKDKNITLLQFVALDEVDPIYFDRSFYVKAIGADKAFSVLLQAMQSQKKAGIAKTVLGTKESLLLLRVKDGNLIADTLFFYDEIVKAPPVSLQKPQKQELELAKTLINQMTKPFKPEQFKDEYNKRLRKAIKAKIAGNKIVKPKERAMPSKIINLMDALQKSLAGEKEKRKKA